MVDLNDFFPHDLPADDYPNQRETPAQAYQRMARTRNELHRQLRERQRRERPEAAKAVDRAMFGRIHAEADREGLPETPDPFETDPEFRLDRDLVDDPEREVRPGVLPCVTKPAGSSYCDGSVHQRRHFSPQTGRWYWVSSWCPILLEERRIDAANRPAASAGRRTGGVL